MSQKPKDAEQELEKQYTAYRAQYETWKEANRGSIGTTAYNEYVTQFENWERDVEKRRKNIKERAEREEREARMKQLEEEERQRKTQAQKEAEDAEAYLQSQQSYLAHHQAAIEAERAKTQMQTVQYHVATQNYGVVHADGAYGATAVVAATISAPSGGGVPAGPANAPVLWGSNKINYDTKDPMYQKWGIRAAPPHIPMLMRGPTVPTAGWMVTQAMNDRKKIVAPQLSQPKMSAPPPSLFALPPMLPMKGLMH